MLADVDGGSDTPSLVGKVLKWRKEKFEDGNDPRILNPFSSLTLIYVPFTSIHQLGPSGNTSTN